MELDQAKVHNARACLEKCVDSLNEERDSYELSGRELDSDDSFLDGRWVLVLEVDVAKCPVRVGLYDDVHRIIFGGLLATTSLEVGLELAVRHVELFDIDLRAGWVGDYEWMADLLPVHDTAKVKRPQAKLVRRDQRRNHGHHVDSALKHNHNKPIEPSCVLRRNHDLHSQGFPRRNVCREGRVLLQEDFYLRGVRQHLEYSNVGLLALDLDRGHGWLELENGL